MQFIFSPIQGALSDRFGRRPVILISNFGLGADYILMALAPGLGVLFVGRVISGICAASYSSATAYIADITPAEQRAARFGLIGMAFGFGFVVGPALGGVLGSINPRLPFWVAGGLSLANGLFGLFVLPESLPLDRRQAWSWRRANPVGALTLLGQGQGMVKLAVVSFLFALAQNALASITVLYTTYRYAWTQASIGYMLAGFGVAGGVVAGVLAGRVVKIIGEQNALLTGLAFGIAGLGLMGAAPTGAWFLAAIPVLSLWNFIGPAMTSLMSRQVDGRSQGQLAGVNSSLMAVAGLIGPILYTESFAHFVTPGGHVHVPGAPYFIAAVLLVVGLGVAASRGKEAVLS
jgi:DHA1 family tetracycline resistance protein-like MFS transporter